MKLNLAMVSGLLTGEPKKDANGDVKFSLTQENKSKDGKVFTQQIFCKLIGKNAKEALDLQVGAHVYVEGRMRFSKEAKISYVESYRYQIL